MNDNTTDLLADNVINEFYRNNNYKMKHGIRRKHNGITLETLDTVSRRIAHHNHIVEDALVTNHDEANVTVGINEEFFDDDDLTTDGPLYQALLKDVRINEGNGKRVQSRVTKKLQPLVTNDGHRVVHLMHKVAAVSGNASISSKISSSSPNVNLKSTMKKSLSSPIMATAVDSSDTTGSKKDQQSHSLPPIIRTDDVAKYQLKIMQGSADLKAHMTQVLHLHDHLSTIIGEQLTHRAELAQAVTTINDRYIELFELVLAEMLKTQRLKFKVVLVAY